MKKVLSFILTAILTVSAVPIQAFAADDQVDLAVLNLEDHVEVTADEPTYPDAPDGYSDYDDYRDSTGYVHDTEFYYDQQTKTWYYYVTNSSEIWSSKNLVNWTRLESNRNGNAWAPCILKLRKPVEFEGKTYTYALWDSLSTFGTRESWIRLWLSNSPTGGFVYAGDTVTSLLNDGKTHNAIDPTVFYDEDGTMWMTFGSFFGGLYLFEMNQKTLKPAYPEDTPGERIVYRSHYMNSIEGPTIIYNPDTEYYYLAVSYGSLDNTYNVRIGRSKNVEGPYYDYNGLPLNNENYSYAETDQIGTKITSPYSFDNDKGWYSTGHCAFLYNPDTNEYFLSHNGRQETVRNTHLNIRKIYWTEDGWPVVSPELYVEGETEQTIPTRCIPGTYEFIEMFREDLPVEPSSAVKRTSSKIQLNEDHSITGSYKGTWIQTGDNTLALALGDTVYAVTVAAGWDWENWKPCLIFTGLSEAAKSDAEALQRGSRAGLGIWGKKVELETTLLADFTFDDKENGLSCENSSAKGEFELKQYDGGTAAYFDGVSDFMKITAKDGGSLLKGKEELTVSMNLLPEAGGTNWAFFAASNDEPQTFNREKYLGILDKGETINSERFNNNGSRPTIGTAVKNTTGWYHLTVVYKPNETIIYINGQEANRVRSNVQLSDVLTNSSVLYLGKANWNAGEFYKGYIDDCMIIGRGLDSAEVAAFYAGNKDPKVSSLSLTAPVKMEYEFGEDLDLSGMQVIANYTNYRTEVVTEKCVVTGYDANTAGEQIITVSYDDAETTFVVIVKEEWIDLPDLPYEDVTDADWFYDAVAYTYYENLMTGMDETHFGPYGQLSRAQFALILHRMEDEVSVETDKSFGDITGEEWYGSAVLWAAENGIVTGYQNGNFGPADMITREQMAVMMYRYAKYLGEDVNKTTDFSDYVDADQVSSFAKEAMEWAVGNGIITGKDNGTKLDPQGNTARSEAAIIIQRFMK